uniref:NADP-dependent oxidoreductase domain-containing protein n=1 Tax=Palpitomonas bilix TaxID=652834 RepID=A0A7S3DJC3_9EUKA|mmetsp:Transcript_40592/g.105371  ORF Transcript_40592/g.105371 Transcript_40592/m.105371 type:complete len:361 (+) Transcript_40592:65-1147(+)
MANPSSFTLSSGHVMPAVGLGTFRVKGEDCYNIVREALRVGYRLIDTASVYRNEKEVGDAIRDSGIPREEVFVTTKLSPRDQHGYEAAMRAMRMSISRLNVGYIDLFLIHWPGRSGKRLEPKDNYQMRMESWHALEDLVEEGVVRSIGVSNYTQRHIEQMLTGTYTNAKDGSTRAIVIPPSVNQVELHPLYPQTPLRRYCDLKGIHVQAYSSLGQGDERLLKHPLLEYASRKCDVSPFHLLLHWGLSIGCSVLPRTSNIERVESNLISTQPDHAFPSYLSLLSSLVAESDSIHSEGGREGMHGGGRGNIDPSCACPRSKRREVVVERVGEKRVAMYESVIGCDIDQLQPIKFCWDPQDIE